MKRSAHERTCRCGCGEPLPKPKNRGRRRLYLNRAHRDRFLRAQTRHIVAAARKAGVA